MSGGLENIREQMVDYLKEQGVQAFAAWPAGERPVQEGALVVELAYFHLKGRMKEELKGIR